VWHPEASMEQQVPHPSDYIAATPPAIIHERRTSSCSVGTGEVYFHTEDAAVEAPRALHFVMPVLNSDLTACATQAPIVSVIDTEASDVTVTSLPDPGFVFQEALQDEIAFLREYLRAHLLTYSERQQDIHVKITK
jgi:hypothetical protein